MKLILTTLALCALSSFSFAGCGKTETTEGKLKSIDLEKKELVVSAKGKDTTIKLTPATTGADKAADLKGKKVTVVTSHGKAVSVKG